MLSASIKDGARVRAELNEAGHIIDVHPENPALIDAWVTELVKWKPGCGKPQPGLFVETA